MVYWAFYHALPSLGLTKDSQKKELLNKLCKVHAMEYFATTRTGPMGSGMMPHCQVKEIAEQHVQVIPFFLF